MTTVNNILDFIESITPQYMQYEWDNTGMLCGSRTNEVNKILVALDPFEEVCQEAAEIGADLLITHHPLIFSAPKAINDETDMGRAIMVLIKNGITAVTAHTNLDCAPGGINDTLAEVLGLQDVEIINPKGGDVKYGLLRMGTVAHQTLKDFMAIVKERLGCQGLRYVDGGKPIHKVAVGGGSCGSDLYEAIQAGCDTFVTADVKYNQFHEAKASGINMIDAGHFHTENPGCIILADKLRNAFPEITVEFSKKHKDHMKFFL